MTVRHCPAPEMRVSLFPTVPEGLIRSLRFSCSSFLSCWVKATFIFYLFLYVRAITQSYRTLGDPMDCSPPGSSVHGILQARILEWVAVPFSRGSSQPRDWTRVSPIAGRHFTSHQRVEYVILLKWMINIVKCVFSNLLLPWAVGHVNLDFSFFLTP